MASLSDVALNLAKKGRFKRFMLIEKHKSKEF